MEKYRIGVVGLGTMGRNLLLNIASHGFPASGFDLDPDKTALLASEGINLPVKGFNDIADFVLSLEKPAVIILLVPAGKIVDEVITALQQLLKPGDIVIDGGNSHFSDTTNRVTRLEGLGLHFFGMGISGGEEGARLGPSLMPGGDKEAYHYVQPVLEAIAARVNDEPCVTYIGPGASGHFVKMVHNGIEYAIMQLIADTYEIMRTAMGWQNQKIQETFASWNAGELQSYLLEITADIFAYQDADGSFLLDKIKDEARSKGTGKWTTQISTDLELPVPSIDMAVAMRDLSKYKSLRVSIAAIYSDASDISTAFKEKGTAELLKQAYHFAMISVYAQGIHLLSRASAVYRYQLKMDEIAKIWRGGCIIRSAFLEVIRKSFSDDPGLSHLFLSKETIPLLKEFLPAARTIVAESAKAGISIPVMASALGYYDALRSERLPLNLIQAQRDYFGAHTYELLGKDGVFHTEWNAPVVRN